MRRVGRGWIEVVDDEGRRHLVPASSRIEVSDVDGMRSECIVVVGARRILVSRSYEEVVEALLEAELHPLGRR
ncbi:hypothetical protein [Microvirga tunisiensis]|uniref:Uncharacterized protein n=1 Tax=Microvirga tunisiensis TaxID=2108360 RepID=A0A5N7MG72_9HYPH|nr:hypothetical protein [Microvirga tunisiensis]MPR06206.1 hypothetical protein [Microvirga tunisiensis]MPR26051.1 hypothetical protein [Microvirga tunisiensis]